MGWLSNLRTLTLRPPDAAAPILVWWLHVEQNKRGAEHGGGVQLRIGMPDMASIPRPIHHLGRRGGLWHDGPAACDSTVRPVVSCTITVRKLRVSIDGRNIIIEVLTARIEWSRTSFQPMGPLPERVW